MVIAIKRGDCGILMPATISKSGMVMIQVARFDERSYREKFVVKTNEIPGNTMAH